MAWITFEEGMKAPYKPFVDSYNRMGVVLRLYSGMRRDSFFKVLGSAWSGCDNLWRYTDELNEIFLCNWQHWRHLMNKWADDGGAGYNEPAAFDELPESFTVYRACSEVNMFGLSWTTNKDVALDFLKYHRYQAPKDCKLMVLAGEVKKVDVVAIKLCREEQEIIIPCSMQTVENKRII